MFDDQGNGADDRKKVHETKYSSQIDFYIICAM